MKLFAKGLLLIAIPSAIELALLGVVFDTQAEAAAAAKSAENSKQILWQASSLAQPLLREAARVRTAVVLEDPSFIDRRAVWAEFSDRISQLEHMVSDNPAQLARIQRINDDARAWRVRCGEVADALRDGRASGFERVSSDGLPPEIEAVRSELDGFIAEQTRLDEARSASLRETRERQQDALIFAVVGSMLIWAATAIVYARNVGLRLAALSANAQRLSMGVALARPLDGDDEIAALDAVLNQTSRRLREAEHEQAALKLQLQERATDLAAANDNLRQESQDNEMFIYSVSHDLRSPLVNLQGFSKELQVSCDDLREQIDSANLSADEHRRMVEVLDGDVDESQQFLRQAVARAAAIIDALLRMSRAGRLDYRWQRVNVGRIVERALAGLAAGLAQQARIEVRDLPPAWGDPGALEQIFGNLIDNALRHLDPARPGHVEIGALELGEGASATLATSRGGVPGPLGLAGPLGPVGRLADGAARAVPPVMTPVHARDAARLSGTRTRTYYVRDNGIGIPAAYLPKLFHAFQRLHGGDSTGQGTGLALARRIAERHGGRIWVESTEGAGSTFFVALPDEPLRAV